MKKRYLTAVCSGEAYQNYFEIYYAIGDVIYRSHRNMYPQATTVDIKLNLFDFEEYLHNNPETNNQTVEFVEFLDMFKNSRDVHNILRRYYKIKTPVSKVERILLHSQVQGRMHSYDLLFYFIQDDTIYRSSTTLTVSPAILGKVNFDLALDKVDITECEIVKLGDYINEVDKIYPVGSERVEIMKKIKNLLDVKV